MESKTPQIIFIVGPTASGKTQFAIEAAERFGGEIISCDSIQVYQGLEIGSAKPSSEDLARVPHHLISHVGIGSNYTAGDFVRDFHEILKRRPDCPLFYVVGGTGFYFMALEKGMHDLPPVDEAVRAKVAAKLEEDGLEKLFAYLEEEDPEYAAAISPNDNYRVIRAVENIYMGKLPSDLRRNFAAKTFPYPLLKLGMLVDRTTLRERVKNRVHAMLASGLISEVKKLLAVVKPEWAPMHSVGYKEAQQFLNDELTEEELPLMIETKTMQLAKRQMTWFRRDKDIFWFSFEEKSAAFEKIADFTRQS
jgi:tRNA dimethylallyltransferase